MSMYKSPANTSSYTLPYVPLSALERKVKSHSDEERHTECARTPTVLELDNLACSDTVASVEVGEHGVAETKNG